MDANLAPDWKGGDLRLAQERSDPCQSPLGHETRVCQSVRAAAQAEDGELPSLPQVLEETPKITMLLAAWCHATITVAGDEIEATFLHPFWVIHGEDLANRPFRDHLPRVPEGTTTSGRWVDAGEIRVGDELLLRGERTMPVQAIRHQPYHDKVYNFHVKDLQCCDKAASPHLTRHSSLIRWPTPQLLPSPDEQHEGIHRKMLASKNVAGACRCRKVLDDMHMHPLASYFRLELFGW
jgi:hypothetical protein